MGNAFDDFSTGSLAVGAMLGFATCIFAVAVQTYLVGVVGAIAFGLCLGTLCRRAS